MISLSPALFDLDTNKMTQIAQIGGIMTMIFVDHQTLSQIAGFTPGDNENAEYQDFLESIRREVLELPADQRQVITLYYFETREIVNIATELGLPESDIRKLLRDGLNMLRHRLADLVRKRWPTKFAEARRCPICAHPRRREIEAIVKARKPADSWGKVNRELRKRFGCSFNPPSVLISHLKFHQ